MVGPKANHAAVLGLVPRQAIIVNSQPVEAPSIQIGSKCYDDALQFEKARQPVTTRLTAEPRINLLGYLAHDKQPSPRTLQ